MRLAHSGTKIAPIILISVDGVCVWGLLYMLTHFWRICVYVCVLGQRRRRRGRGGGSCHCSVQGKQHDFTAIWMELTYKDTICSRINAQFTHWQLPTENMHFLHTDAFIAFITSPSWLTSQKESMSFHYTQCTLMHWQLLLVRWPESVSCCSWEKAGDYWGCSVCL